MNVTPEPRLRRTTAAVAPDDTGALIHEFNNLLARMLAASEQLTHDLESDSQSQRLATLCLDSAERCAKLLPRIRSAAGRRPAIANLDGLELIETTARFLRPFVRETIAVRTEARGEVDCLCDRSELERALAALALNALAAMPPEGGELRLEAEALRLNPVPARRLGLQPGRYVAFAVHGPGAAPLTQPTTARPAPGAGLGLAPVAAFARDFLSALKITSAPGKGATVTLYVPARD